ncbi:tetratricopeptide repeat protein [Micromonospora sp. NPDC000089]|uniref:AfsR/SARP family transcriptional regulator n=1 Tax=unclassified Micromonospora TaxID=2617518 RepID=UPI0036797359
MGIRLLGAAEASLGRAAIPVGTPKQQLVLAMLAVHAGRLVTVAELVDELWPEAPPRSAVANVRTYAANLRRAFDAVSTTPGVLVRDGLGYRLMIDRSSVDVLRLLDDHARARNLARSGQVESAMALLAAVLDREPGHLLAGLEPGPVLLGWREAVERETESVVELLAGLQIDSGRPDLALPLLRTWTARHPVRERLRTLLMRALLAVNDHTEAIAVYQATRQALQQQWGVRPGEEMEQLHHAAVRARRSPALPDGPVQARAPYLRRSTSWLPPAVPDFIGRADVVARLLDDIRRASAGGPVVRVIDGMAGCGKTALAVHLAGRLAEDYPDAQLFIDLRGHGEAAQLQPEAILFTLLRQLGVPAGRVPVEFADRVELWRRELALRRTIVVLDNAAGGAQIQPLLPTAPGVVVLVTARSRVFAAEVGLPESLSVLTPDEAVDLLAATAGENRVRTELDAAAEVVRRCGYLPLAIRLAGARLAHRKSWRVADLAQRLIDGYSAVSQLAVEQKTVASAFGTSYEPLSEQARRVFRLLALHPGQDFTLTAAAALVDLPLEATSRVVDDLVDRHLLGETGSGHYRLHDLMRQYAVELSRDLDEESARIAAVRRLLDHVLHVSVHRTEHLEPARLRRQLDLGPPERPDLLDHAKPADVEWVERERSSLVALVGVAEEIGSFGYAWRLARALWRFSYIRGYFDDIVATHRTGLAAAQRGGDRRAESAMHNYLASAYTRTANYQIALRHLEAAVDICQVLGDHSNENRYRSNLVVVHWLVGNLEQAVTLGRQLLRARRATLSESIVALPNLGIALAASARHHEALQVHRTHLFLARCVGDQFGILNALGHLGAVQARLGRHQQAIRLLTASLRLRDRTGHRFAEGETRNDLAVVYRALGRWKDARAQHDLALEMAIDSGERHVQAAVLNDLGRTAAADGRTAEAMKSHSQALTLATRIGHPYEQARALMALAEHLDDPTEARRYRQRAEAIFERMGVVPEWSSGPPLPPDQL